MSSSSSSSSAVEEREPKTAAQKLADRVERAKGVALNKEIAAFARQKNLTGAAESFETARSKGWLNAHTFCAIMNAYIRCGDVDGAERMFRLLQKTRGVRMDVVSCTTMLKGYSGVGDIASGRRLLEEMFAANPKVMPNVRTVNTFLRGCLLAGHLQASEEVLAHCQKTFAVTPDVSTWEYVVTLLCQGLCIDKVTPIIGRLKGDPAMASGVRNMYVGLARACALLGEEKACLKALRGAEEMLRKAEEEELKLELTGGGSDDEEEDGEDGVVIGGKRAWKKKRGEDGGDEGDAREQSLEVILIILLYIVVLCRYDRLLPQLDPVCLGFYTCTCVWTGIQRACEGRTISRNPANAWIHDRQREEVRFSGTYFGTLAPSVLFRLRKFLRQE